MRMYHCMPAYLFAKVASRFREWDDVTHRRKLLANLLPQFLDLYPSPLVDLAAALTPGVQVNTGSQTTYNSFATLPGYLAARDAVIRRLSMLAH